MASMVRVKKGDVEDTFKCPLCGVWLKVFVGTDPTHEVGGLVCLQLQIDALRRTVRDIVTRLEGGP